MNKQLVADLKAARALIDTPEKWLKGTLYGDNDGAMVRVGWATCFCMDGAIDRACSDGLGIDHNRATAAVEALGLGGSMEVWKWNDAPERTHAEVMAAFDKAIEKAEAQ